MKGSCVTLFKDESALCDHFSRVSGFDLEPHFEGLSHRGRAELAPVLPFPAIILVKEAKLVTYRITETVDVMEGLLGFNNHLKLW